MSNKKKNKITLPTLELIKKKFYKHFLFLVYTILIIVVSGYIYGDNSIFLKEFKWNNAVLKYLYLNVPTIITTIFVIAGIYYVGLIVKLILENSFRQTKRGETIVNMLISFCRYVFALVGALIILSVWGVNSATLIASAGGLALIVGLGAQSLVSDVIAGVFIVFEDEFNVGDIIEIDNWRGKVLTIGIRSTKFIDIAGDIKTINNSKITSVINKTKELSLVTVVVGINYSANLKEVEEVLKNEVPSIHKNIDGAKDEVKYLGVDELNSSSVDLLFATHCQEENMLSVKRQINREIKLIFDRNNIEIPYQHITVEYNNKNE